VTTTRSAERKRGLRIEIVLPGLIDDPEQTVFLHKLKGARKKQWAMTVNDRWRICFEFRAGDAFDVEIVDYHKG